MKSYGVNWFLVWLGLLVFLGPLFVWVDLFLFSHWHSPPDSHEMAVAQAFCQPFCWTFLYYLTYERTLSDPQAFDRLRQHLQRGKNARRRHRWPVAWATAFVLIGTTSTISRLIFDRPSWLYMVAYSLLVPCGCLVCFWLLNKATEKGQLAQRLKEAP